MKQFLLCAAVALVATSASAQSFSAKENKLPTMSSSVKPELMKSEKKQMKIVAAPEAKGVVSMTNKFAQKRAKVSLDGLTYTKTSAARTIAKAAGVQDVYNASGTSVDGNMTWQMSKASDEAGNFYLADVIANEWPNVVDHIFAEASVSGSTVTVPAQSTGLYSTGPNGYHVIMFGGTEADGSIKMQLGEDGSLSLPTGEVIFYGAFSTDEFDPTLNTYLGYLDMFTNIQYALPGQVLPPTTYIQPNGVYLHAFNSPSGYGFIDNVAMMPANAYVNFDNFTTGAVTSYNWSVDKYLGQNETEAIKGTDKTFAFKTEGGATYGPVSLTAWNQDVNSVYTWGLQNETDPEVAFNSYAGGSSDSFVFTDGTSALMTIANPDFELAYDPNFATPGIARYSIHKLVMYQGKPEAPLYIEGVNMYVRSFVPNNDFNLTCQLVKVTRNANGKISIGDVIAESSISVENAISNGTTGITDLRFTDFYSYDEDGLTVGLDHLFLDEEFAIVIDGWDNGTFSCYPYLEYNANDLGVTYTYFYETGDEEHLYGFTGYNAKAYIGFIGASYGYLETTGSTTFDMPTNGGKASITVHPMLCSVDNTVKKTRLFLDDDSEMPDWVAISFANENYDTDYYKFDLVVEAEALPAGVDGRSAKLRLWQEGAYIDVTINQGDVSGVSTVVTSTGKKNGQAYNLAGQKVAAGAKGIVIRDGKKFIGK